MVVSTNSTEKGRKSSDKADTPVDISSSSIVSESEADSARCTDSVSKVSHGLGDSALNDGTHVSLSLKLVRLTISG